MNYKEDKKSLDPFEILLKKVRNSKHLDISDSKQYYGFDDFEIFKGSADNSAAFHVIYRGVEVLIINNKQVEELVSAYETKIKEEFFKL